MKIIYLHTIRVMGSLYFLLHGLIVLREAAIFVHSNVPSDRLVDYAIFQCVYFCSLWFTAISTYEYDDFRVLTVVF